MRRLLAAAAVLLAVAAAIAAWPLFPSFENRPSSEVCVGMPGDFPPDSVRRFPEAGVFVVCDGKGIFAVSGKCTHLGCPLQWDEKKDDFRCDCHGSRFDAEGRVIASPAREPLPHYAITYREGVGLVVDTSRASTDPKEWKKEPYYFPLGDER